MTSGKCYRLYNGKTGELSAPFYVVAKHRKNKLDIYEIATSSYCPTVELKVNRDYDGVDVCSGIVGETGSFLEVEGDGHEYKKRTDGQHALQAAVHLRHSPQPIPVTTITCATGSSGRVW